MASPDLIARLEEFETSRTAHLGPEKKKGETHKGSNDVIMELKRDPWKIETVIIV